MDEMQQLIFDRTITIPPKYLSETYHELTAISVMIEVINFWNRLKNGR